jgi:hypothetical protein
MNHTQAIDLLIENIENLKLPQINRLKHLENQEPTIYLCGKSSTGKTTFLNALFNIEKDELFTSTNISTKTEFRFQYGEEEIIEKSDGSSIILPDNHEERKLLFKSLNEEGNSYSVTLNQEALKNRIIVDIPGVFDFKRNDGFSNSMLDEADIVYFFTPCTAKINESEYNLLESIQESGIPIIVLFTMGDITEVDEGITRKTMPKYVQNRLSSCFKDLDIEHYQIISSNDFFKNKDSHGIDVLQEHILGNDNKYKQAAEKNRLKRTVGHYLNQIEVELDTLKNDSETFKKLVIKENKLWYESEKNHLEKEKAQIIKTISSELTWILNYCEKQIFGISNYKFDTEKKISAKEVEKNFQSNWDDFWNNFKIEFEFLQIRGLKLPPVTEKLFKPIKINIEKLKEVLSNNSEVDSEKGSSTEKTSSNPKEKKEPNAEIKKDKSSSSKDKKEELNTNKNSWKNLSWEDWFEIVKETGVSFKNAKAIWNKWSYLKEVKATIDQVKDDIMEQIEDEFESRSSRLEEERNKKLEVGISKDPTTTSKSKYNESLSQLKTI